MYGCHTDCLERPLSNGFRQLGVWVARYPWWFLGISVLISGGLGAGFYFYPQRLSFHMEDQFMPLEGLARRERDFIRHHFPTNDSWEFSVERLDTEGMFASLIAVSTSGNILTASAFHELLKLDEMVKSLHVSWDHLGAVKNFTFMQLCTRVGTMCVPVNHLLRAVHGNASAIESLNFTYPLFQGHEFMGSQLGGVHFQSSQPHVVQGAKAIRLVYYLQEEPARAMEINAKWLEKYIDAIATAAKSLHLKSIQVSFFTSISHQQDIAGHLEEMPPLLSITYILTTLFSVLSCLRFDCVRNKAGVAMLGVISSGLALAASGGLLMYCGVPCVISVANAPFLSLGAGVDNMFIMISCWQQTKISKKVEDRLAETYAAAAVSITITSMTDVLAFYIGIMTPFTSVKSFCIYTGTAVLFCFLYCITFFGAVLALNGKREEDNRHWLACVKVKCASEDENSFLHRLCCVGGSYDSITGAEEEHPITIFFHSYGPFLTQFWCKILVVVLYFGYLAASIYGCFQLQEGTGLRNLASEGSYLIQYYESQDIYFSKYGPKVMVTVTKTVSYWDPSIRNTIEKCMQSFESTSFVDRGLSESWLRDYTRYSVNMSLNLDDRASFMASVASFFHLVPHYKNDIVIQNGSIEASRFFIQTVNVTPVVNSKKMLRELRKIAMGCTVPLMVYHPTFMHLDQYDVIVQSTIQNVVVATGLMLFISLLLIPNPLCSLWVTFANASIIVGVTGFMAYWNVNLDSVSMINLIICIGFSVDFSAHISYAFVTSQDSNANERVNNALHLLGYPIVQGALSTILGVIALSASGNYLFKSFFKIMFLVIMFGAVHGLVFIPVFLTFFGVCAKQCSCGAKIKKFDKGQQTSCIKDPVQLGCFENQAEGTEGNSLPGTVVTTPSIINIGNVYNGYLFHPGQNIMVPSVDAQRGDSKFCSDQNDHAKDFLKQIKLLHSVKKAD
ncbi:patched domain-containing protein 3-like [Ambystoma mexicanum]|uniref:patched domain-containing protein 3-like n=1 Tax=Ambystoma mexicanum TaxID=8296 RepID=UPI0037E911BC